MASRRDDNTVIVALRRVLLVVLPSVTDGGKWDGKVGDGVFGRVQDAVLLVQIDHGGLDVGMTQHGLDLSDRRTMFQCERGGRMSKRMRGDRTDALGIRVDQPTEARLLEMVAHHGLNRTDS